MSKLNLEELIPGALWVDKEHGMYVRRDPGDNDRFYACHPESGKQYGYYTTKQRAVQDLEALIEPSLDEQDEKWIRQAFPNEELQWRLRQAALSGIEHERKRVSRLLALTDPGKHEVKSIRKNLGLDPQQ